MNRLSCGFLLALVELAMMASLSACLRENADFQEPCNIGDKARACSCGASSTGTQSCNSQTLLWNECYCVKKDSQIWSGVDGGILDDFQVFFDRGGSGGNNCNGKTKFYNVINKFFVPNNNTQYAADVNGDGKSENAFGAMMKNSGNILQTVQDNLDNAVKNGSLLFVIEFDADSLNEARPITVSQYFAEDSDQNLNNNFTGAAMFKYSADNPDPLPVLTGSITQSVLFAGQGKALGVFPLQGTPGPVSWYRAMIKGRPGCDNIIEGQINGAILVSDAEKLVHSGNNVYSTYADTDATGFGNKNAFSIGLGFTAVSCTVE